MGNCSNKTDKHIYENEKPVKYRCQLCIEQNIEPLYYSKEMIEVEVIDGKVVNKVDKKFDEPKYNKYGKQINKRKYIYAVVCSNKHEVVRGDMFEVGSDLSL